MKKFKKGIAVCLILISMASIICIPANAVGNIQDKYINVSASDNDGGTPRRSSWEPKEDTTSVWCENKSSSGGSLSAWVHRSNSKQSTSFYTVDRYYGSWSYNGATKNMKTVPKGSGKYLINYVKEDGYSYAALGFILNREHVAYRIAWSPDSV